MRFIFQVEVEVERSEGKFASRDELAEQIMEEIESADPQNLSGEAGGEYETTSWDVEDISDQQRKAKK